MKTALQTLVTEALKLDVAERLEFVRLLIPTSIEG
jgi:hypothetical protein